jgi:hypothetical protein
VTTVQQGFHEHETLLLNGFPLYQSETSNAVNTADTLQFGANGSLTGTTDRSSSQKYFTRDSTGYCYSRELRSAAGLLTAVEDGKGCPKARDGR